MKRALIVLLIVAAIGAGAGAYYIRRGGPEITVNTSPITRGDVIDAVGSTGTLQAVTTVQVGSQVSGNIMELNADFNSIVKKGQVIAKLDPSLFNAQMEQTKANLTQARANQTKALSDLERTKVQLLDAQQKYTRSKDLAAKSLVPQSDLDAAKIAVDTAQANLQSQQATVAQTAAAIVSSEASVNQNQVNLEHTIITAPIDGIVTQRSVDVGQTVAASMSAPTLFIIAADLTKMQVSANIDESDVGRIRPGQRVTFRVDAYPTEEFVGTVTQIRLQPVVQSNVTTYGTIINVPNPELKLKPGMTANLKVEVAHRVDVLRAPNAAVRFRPTADLFAALNQPVPPEALTGPGGRGGRGGRNAQAGTAQGGNGAAPQAGANNAARANGPVAVPTAAPAPAQAGNAPAAAAPNLAPQDGAGGGNRRRGNGQADGQGGGQPGQGGGGGGGGRGGFGRGGDPAQLLERFKAMEPAQQQQFIERMKSRGQDTTALEAAMAKPGRGGKPAAAVPGQAKYGSGPTAATIDALFPPLPVAPPTPGRVWLYVDKQLKPVAVRLGISDGTNTELVTDQIQQNTEVVTNVTGLTGTRPQAGGAGGNGNPLLGNQQRGGPPGGFGGGAPAGGRGR